MQRFALSAAAVGLSAGAILAALGAGPAGAEDFTFRRVGVPGSGAADRITVQIDPADMWEASAPSSPWPPSAADLAAVGLAPGGGSGGAATQAGVEWFWTGVSPLLADSGPGRLDQALRVLSQSPDGMPAPRLQSLQDIAEAYGADILRATVGTRVSPALALAVIAVESAGRPAAVSPVGATGLMQLMPGTAARFGVRDSTVAADNIRGGVAYLDWLLHEFGEDPILALAGYNAGEGAVMENAGVPPYAETRAYVPKVLAAWSVARGLCVTPPELASDGCVFAVGAPL